MYGDGHGTKRDRDWGWLNHVACHCGGGQMTTYLPKPVELHSIPWLGSVSEVEKLNGDVQRIGDGMQTDTAIDLCYQWLAQVFEEVGMKNVNFHNFDEEFMVKGPENCTQTSDSGQCVSHGPQGISPKYVWTTNWRWYQRRKLAGTAFSERPGSCHQH